MIINNPNKNMLYAINYQNKNVKEYYFNKMDNIVFGMTINVKDKNLQNVKMQII